jgi:hypothetical protein
VAVIRVELVRSQVLVGGKELQHWDFYRHFIEHAVTWRLIHLERSFPGPSVPAGVR